MARIMYCCSAKRRPTGGNKITYRHVDLLNQLGFEGWVLHPRAGFRYQDLTYQPPMRDWINCGCVLMMWWCCRRMRGRACAPLPAA